MSADSRVYQALCRFVNGDGMLVETRPPHIWKEEMKMSDFNELAFPLETADDRSWGLSQREYAAIHIAAGFAPVQL